MKNNQKIPNLLRNQNFFVCMYKMFETNKEAYEKCDIEIIDDKEYFRINTTDLETESEYKNWAVIFDK